MSLVRIDYNLCCRDNLCIKECPAFVLIPSNNGYPTCIENAAEICINCGHCVTVCPNSAIAHKFLTPKDCLELEHDKTFSVTEVVYFLRKRRSIRQYENVNPDNSLIHTLLSVSKYAPSARNLQPVNWIVINNKNKVNFVAYLVFDWMRKKIIHKKLSHFKRIIKAWEKGQDRILRGAPTLVVGHANKLYNYAALDITTSISYIELAAPSYGLGTCWAGYFTSASKESYELKRYLQLPRNHVVHGALMLGFPKVKYYRMPERKDQNINWM